MLSVSLNKLPRNLPRNLLVLLIASSAINSHAALFDDKEARKKILEVEAKSQSNFEANQAAINELKKNQATTDAVIKGQGLADMQNQLEALKQEIANLKGELELANHHLEN